MARLGTSDLAPYESAGAARMRPSNRWIAGLINRLASLFDDAVQRRVEREIDRQIEAHGGRMTDELERKMELIVRSHGGC